MTVQRYTANSWRDGPLSRRRQHLGATSEQRLAVAGIVERVRSEGDAALFEFSQQFDGWRPQAGERLEIDRPAMARALEGLGPGEREALEEAATRIRAYHATQTYEESSGDEGLRLITRPVRSAGLYVPGGRAAYPSSVLMTAIPARVAGVTEIVLATPPAPDGSVPGAVLAAAALAGVDAVYRMGGAQAIAALAFGTESVRPVDLIAGPGNIYVALAKREVFGTVGIDALAGPTEIMVLADRSAAPELVAADLASQMEHDPMTLAILVTDSPALADAVEEQMSDIVPDLQRREVVEAARCCLVVADSAAQALQIADDFAPEHLSIMAEDGADLSRRIHNAGAIFLGPWTPVALADYVIGPNHTLPTGGSARFASPLGVYTFLKRTSVAGLTEGEFVKLQGSARRLAGMEGLGAHASALAIRMGEGLKNG
ncbi:MAG: histidinol dehydrogenase [Candidatus Dormibacteraceae bacterium]